MSLIKEKNENTKDYILQKDKTTKRTGGFIAVVLIVLITAVIASGYIFKWF
ncbi:hypothetical protein [Olleya sp. ITB9]|uniref:hypothetical protein n=1 Tax=Olleya sp. ITB9 TaxID=1715648 RepID=UPI000AD0BCAF|nr:hypothetical protein [Olleya sp. ITB9]